MFFASIPIVSANQTLSLNAPQVTLAGSTTKSYREWKISMVTEAEARLKATKDSLVKIKIPVIDASAQAELKMMQNRFYKESLQLSMAHDLTISDYFVGYLTKQKELNKAIKEVSGRLTAEEVAELMSAYANNFFSSRPASSKANPQADRQALSTP